MPKPIPASLLAQFKPTFDAIYKSYREGQQLYIPPAEAGIIGTSPADPALLRGPCWVCEKTNRYAPAHARGNILTSEQESAMIYHLAQKNPSWLKLIPEIEAILNYLEEMPDPENIKPPSRLDRMRFWVWKKLYS